MDNSLVGALVAIYPRPLGTYDSRSNPTALDEHMPDGFTWGTPYEIVAYDSSTIDVIDDHRCIRNLNFIALGYKIYKTPNERKMDGMAARTTGVSDT